jgi:hypothetical protein
MGVFKTLEVNLSVPIAEYAELSDEELDGVAGGRRTGEERRAERKSRRLRRKSGRGDIYWEVLLLEYEEHDRGDGLDDGDWNPDQPTLTP